MRFAPATWGPYMKLWLELLGAVHRNGRTPVLFTASDPSDLARYGLPSWCRALSWLLLDCDDAVRRGRLEARPGWTQARLEEALRDARALRGMVNRRLDTGALGPSDVAEGVLAWLREG